MASMGPLDVDSIRTKYFYHSFLILNRFRIDFEGPFFPGVLIFSLYFLLFFAVFAFSSLLFLCQDDLNLCV